MNSVSQSAASQHVQELEKQLGVKLLDRARRPLALTTEGRLYYEFCREVVRRQEEFVTALQQMKGEREGVVRVASIYSVGLTEMARLEQELARRQPGAQIKVEFLRPEKVYEAVITDQADLGMVSYPEAKREIKVIAWREEQMVVAMSPRHALAGEPKLAPEQLAGESFVGFDEDLPIGRDVRRFLREAGVEVNLALHFDNIQMMKEAVAHGSGISILPERILQEDVAQGRIRVVPLAPPGLSRPLGIIHLRRKNFNRPAQAFLALLCEESHQERGELAEALV